MKRRDADTMYADIIESAQAHGENADPEHEVGDLQEVLDMALQLMDSHQLGALHDEIVGRFGDQLDWSKWTLQ